MRYTPMRCTTIRHTLVRCTTMRYTPMRHAYEIILVDIICHKEEPMDDHSQGGLQLNFRGMFAAKVIVLVIGADFHPFLFLLTFL